MQIVNVEDARTGLKRATTVQEWFNESASNLPSRMAESLDNVTAALETCLAHFGHDMPPGDYRQRERLAREARRVLSLIGYRES